MLRRILVLGALGLAAIPAATAGTGAPSLPTTMPLGGRLDVSGFTGSSPDSARRAVGAVVVLFRWDDGAWRVLTRTRTDAKGRYTFSVHATRRGLLTLRITPPDHSQRRLALHVV